MTTSRNPETTCPSCKRAVVARERNPCFPFCSERCRTIDLGRWLGEAYRVPIEGSDDDEDGALMTEPLSDA